MQPYKPSKDRRDDDDGEWLTQWHHDHLSPVNSTVFFVSSTFKGQQTEWGCQQAVNFPGVESNVSTWHGELSPPIVPIMPSAVEGFTSASKNKPAGGGCWPSSSEVKWLRLKLIWKWRAAQTSHLCLPSAGWWVRSEVTVRLCIYWKPHAQGGKNDVCAQLQAQVTNVSQSKQHQPEGNEGDLFLYRGTNPLRYEGLNKVYWQSIAVVRQRFGILPAALQMEGNSTGQLFPTETNVSWTGCNFDSM